jgi:Methyltransferase domain
MKETRKPPIDPFSIKSMSKWNPKRVFPTAFFRLHEFWSWINFARYAIPVLIPEAAHETIPSPPPGETTVTDEQRRILAKCLSETEKFAGVCVEVGSYRGQTTRFLAERTKRDIIAVDPYFEHNGDSSPREAFLKNTAPFSNVRLLRYTSGEAAAHIGTCSFCFIDAVHDYANVRFDVSAYSPKITTGGIIAFHDTDNLAFAGTRRAVYEFLSNTLDFKLLYHVEDLVTLKRK